MRKLAQTFPTQETGGLGGIDEDDDVPGGLELGGIGLNSVELGGVGIGLKSVELGGIGLVLELGGSVLQYMCVLVAGAVVFLIRRDCYCVMSHYMCENTILIQYVPEGCIPLACM